MRSTPHNMAAATANQPQTNIAMIITRLISASSLPRGSVLFAYRSLQMTV
jgi:hypothetical protein